MILPDWTENSQANKSPVTEKRHKKITNNTGWTQNMRQPPIFPTNIWCKVIFFCTPHYFPTFYTCKITQKLFCIMYFVFLLTKGI